MTASELRAARQRLGWSQARTARALGVHDRARISDWETGRRPVPPVVAESVRAQLALADCRARVAELTASDAPSRSGRN